MAALAEHIAQESHAPHDILVIFDIDNTIAHPKTEVGTDQWLEHQAKQQAVDGVTVAQAYQNLLPLYYKIQHITDLHLVENMIAELIADLKTDGVLTLGLTARHDPIIDRTLAQLAPLNVAFSTPAQDEILIEASKHTALYKNGVIFCGQNSKGEVLFKLLTMLSITPKKIFFIDDKMHHLIAVEKMAIERGIECVCIHYTHCQARVDNFDPVQANQELLALNIS
jgi:FMN phosphatase YigB (HAD superfamily)